MSDTGRTALRALLAVGPTRRPASGALVAWETATILRSGGFDTEWYCGQAGRRLGTVAAVRHYLRTGRAQGFSPHPWFEPEWFALTAGPSPLPLDPFTRFLVGDAAGTGSPHPLLDPGTRAATWPAAAAAAAPTVPDAPAGRAPLAAGRPLPQPGADAPAVSVLLVLDDWRACLVSLAALRAAVAPSWEAVVVVAGDPEGVAAVEQVAAADVRTRVVRAEPLGPVVLGCRAPVVAVLREGSRVPASGWADAVARVAAGEVAGAWAGTAPVGTDPTGRVDLVLAGRESVGLAAAAWDVAPASFRRRVPVTEDLAWSLAGTVPLVRLAVRSPAHATDEAPERPVTDTLRVRHAPQLLPATARAGSKAPALSVVVAAADDWVLVRDGVHRVLASTAAAAGATEVVVVDTSVRPASRRMLAALAVQDPRVRRVRVAPGAGRSVAWAAGLAACSAAVVALVDPRVTPAPEALDLLVAHLADPAVLAAAPVVTGPEATIVSAGTAAPPPGDLPVPLLVGLPIEDARRAGPVLRVAATDGGVLVARTADLRAVGGPDPLVGPWAEVDLGLRLAASDPTGHVVVDAGAQAWAEQPVGHRAGSADDLRSGGRELVRRHRFAVGPRAEDLLAPAGLVVVGYRAEDGPGAPDDPRPSVPVLGRAVLDRIGQAPPRLRWSVKIAAPAGEAARRWGDLHFARALAEALERLGQDVVVDHGPAVGRATAYLDDVSLVLRGRDRVPPQAGAIDLLWVISHPELVDDAELAAADAVFVASTSWTQEASRRAGRPATTLLQATDATRFRPDVVPVVPGEPVLFVGNSRGVYRPVVRHLVEAGVQVAVHGGRWHGFLPPGVLRGEHVPNAELPGLYAGAGVVLNDHWEGMRAAGFLSNRLFDAAATGTRVVSDRVEGAEEVLAGLVRCWSTPEELVHLVRHADTEFAPDEVRRRLAEQVVQEHSFDARAQVLVRRAADLWHGQGGSGRPPTERAAGV